MTNQKVAVLGLGNILLCDQGVGVHIINKLEQNYNFIPHVRIIDGGTSGIDLLHQFEDNDKIIIIDSVDFSKGPGFIQCLTDNEITTLFNTNKSPRQTGLLDIIANLKLLKKEPLQIYLIGIQPTTIETGLRLSDQIEQNINKIFEMIFTKLKEWNIETERK